MPERLKMYEVINGQVVKVTVGMQLRCGTCNRYKPDRCTCNGEPKQKALTDKEINDALKEEKANAIHRTR